MAIIGGLQGMIHTIENTSVNNIQLKKVHIFLPWAKVILLPVSIWCPGGTFDTKLSNMNTLKLIWL
jgi:hypothetical protein